jgi:TolA-binding protein
MAQQYAKPPKKAGTVAEPTIVQRPVVDPGATQMASEDVDYLRVLQLLGAGQRDEARAAANEYLNKYPRGLRRLEALSVATLPSR